MSVITLGQSLTKVVTYLGVGQPGGTLGTNEVQLSHDGTNALWSNKVSGGANIITSPGVTGRVSHQLAAGALWALYAAEPAVRVDSAGGLGWSSTTGAEGAIDTTLLRNAAGVLRPSGAAAGNPGWMQSPAGCARVSAGVSASTTTPVSLTDLTVTLLAGRKYFGSMLCLISSNPTTDGIRFAFNGGTATFTTFNAGVTGNAQGATLAVGNITSSSTYLIVSASGSTNLFYLLLHFDLVVNAPGTFMPVFAKQTATGGSAIVYAGTTLQLTDIT